MIQIVHEKIDTIFKCNFDVVNTLVIENPKFFRHIIGQFAQALKNENSEIVISEGNAQIKGKDYIQFCSNYFEFDILKKLNSILSKQLISKLATVFEISSWYQQGYSLLSDILMEYDSHISINELPDYSQIIKLYNPSLQFEKVDDNLQALVKYIDILVEFVNLKLIVFVGIEAFFSKEELIMLFKHCRYKEVSVFMLESTKKYNFDNEKYVIIDKDLCEINNYS